MLSSNGNPFLRAEYLNPPPATNTMDSKKSPLALLAQTCSQIGADPLATLSTKTTDQRKKSECNDLKSTANGESNNNRRPSSGNESSIHPAGKMNKKTNEPANNNRLTPSTIDHRRSKSTSPKNRLNTGGNTMDHPTAASASTGLMTHPLLQPSQQQQLGSSSSSNSHPSQHLMMASSDPSSSLANSYKSLMASAYPASPYAPYAGHGYGAPPHPSSLDFGAYALNAAAVAKSSTSLSSSSNNGNRFIPTSTATIMNGYLASHPAAAYSVAALQQAMHQYGNAANRLNATVTKPTTNVIDPCRDPYCTACPANSNASTAAVGQIHMVCTAGCALSVQCDHVRVPIAAHHLQMLSGAASSANTAAAPPPPSSSPHRPYICNWIVGDNYCGKRFTSSDDLLQHLRTHTNLSSATADGIASTAAFAHPSSMMRAAYPTPPLSPLSAARYHPYGKTTNTSTSTAQQQAGLFHPGMAAAMAAMAGPYGPGQSAAHLFHPALAPYYSHLSLFAHQTNNQPLTRQVPGASPLGDARLGGQP